MQSAASVADQMNSVILLCSVLMFVASVPAGAASAGDLVLSGRPTDLRKTSQGEPIEIYGDVAVLKSSRVKSGGSITALSWTLGLVRYCTTGLSEFQRTQALVAAEMWNQSSAAKLFEDCSGTPRINFVNDPNMTACGASHVGMIADPGGTQQIWIRCWNIGVIAHEFGHALGFFHEHQRSDRESFVTLSGSGCGDPINYGALSSVNYTAYDFASIMHYSSDPGSSCFLQASTRQPNGDPPGSSNFCVTASQCTDLMGQPTVSARDRLGVGKRYGFRVPIVRRGAPAGLSVTGALIPCNGSSECLFDYGATASLSASPPSGHMVRFSGACEGLLQCVFEPNSNMPVFITTYSLAEGATGLDHGVMRDSFEGPVPSVF